MANAYESSRCLGEVIDLVWDDLPDTYYVRGHVDLAEFQAALAKRYDSRFTLGEELKLRQTYAFWAMSGNDGYGNAMRTLRELAEPRSGAFKVTAWDVPPPAERAKVKLAALGAKLYGRTLRLGDGTAWPWPFRKAADRRHGGRVVGDTKLEPVSASWKARYEPAQLTREDLMELADIADAYETLITDPAPSVRDRVADLHVVHDLWDDGFVQDAGDAPASGSEVA